MTDAYTQRSSAPSSMSKDRPKLLLKRVLMELEDAGISDAYSEAELVNAIASTDVNSPARTDFYIQLSSGTSRPILNGRPTHLLDRRSAGKLLSLLWASPMMPSRRSM